MSTAASRSGEIPWQTTSSEPPRVGFDATAGGAQPTGRGWVGPKPSTLASRDRQRGPRRTPREAIRSQRSAVAPRENAEDVTIRTPLGSDQADVVRGDDVDVRLARPGPPLDVRPPRSVLALAPCGARPRARHRPYEPRSGRSPGGYTWVIAGSRSCHSTARRAGQRSDDGLYVPPTVNYGPMLGRDLSHEESPNGLIPVLVSRSGRCPSG